MVGRHWLCVVLCATSIACGSESEDPRELGIQGIERAFPYDDPDDVVEGWFVIDGEHQKLQYEVYGDVAVFGGDVVLGVTGEMTAEQLGWREPDRSAVRPDHKWTNATVPFEVDPDLPKVTKDAISAAIKHWHNNTRVRFVKHEKQEDWVYFTSFDGCASFGIGRQGGMQKVGLAKDCLRGEVIHELGHVVGLYHEQSRTDRAKYIVIHSDNIVDKEYLRQFWTFKQMTKFDGVEYKGSNIGAYDFGSIMHYPWWAFSVDPTNIHKPTITRLKDPKNENPIEGQRDHLSEGDKKGIAFLYGSPGDQTDAHDRDGDDPIGDPIEDDGIGPDYACWLTEVYRDVLGREPDDVGLADWVAALENGVAPGEAVGSFVRSEEALTIFLGGLYRSLLRREPDADGLAIWRTAMTNGVGQLDAAAGFLASDEYWAVVAGSDPRGFVAHLYTEVLGREASAGEIDGWVQITSGLEGSDARRALALEFLTSPERRGLVVEAGYQRYLHRGTDAGGKAAYVEAMDNGLSEEVLAIELVTSPEYQQRCPW